MKMRTRQIQALLSAQPEKQALTFSGKCQDCGTDVSVTITREPSIDDGFYITGGKLYQPYHADGDIFYKCNQCNIAKTTFKPYKECFLRRNFYRLCDYLGVVVNPRNNGEKSVGSRNLPIPKTTDNNVINIATSYNVKIANILSLSRLDDFKRFKPSSILDKTESGIDPDFFIERNDEHSAHAFYINSGICYEWYFAIAKCFKPVSILEIGVRYGYSLLSMIKGAEESIKFVRGWDIETQVPGSSAIATQKIRERIDTVVIDFKIDNISSYRFDSLPCFFDLVHIDGGFSFEGITHDLNICIGLCKVMVIDDYDYLPNVKKATDIFIKTHKANIQAITYIPSYRGSMVIEWLESE